MRQEYWTPAKTMQLALLPALLSLALSLSGPATAATTCSLQLVNSVPLAVADNIAWVPGTVGDKEKLFQLDTSAPDNQMSRDAMKEFGLSATDYTPAQSVGQDGAAFSLGQSFATFSDGSSHTTSFASGPGGIGGGAQAIYNSRGVMFHSMAEAKPFTFGVMRTDGLQFVVTDIPQPGSGGILAADFFHKYDIDLNFAYHKLNMFASDHCPGQVVYWRAPNVARLPFRFDGGRIIVRVMVDGREMNAAIDTGAQRSEMQFDDVDSFFYLNSRSKDVVREDDGHIGHDYGILSFGTVSITHPHLVLTHSLAFQGANSRPMTGTLLRNTEHMAIQPDLTIGMDLLKMLHVYIAFNEGVVYVTQGPELPDGDAHALPVVAVTPQRP